MANEKTLTAADLAQFTGSETWWKHALVPHIRYTDGARYVAQAGEAYWLLDEIALANAHLAKVKREEFQVWKLAVLPRGEYEQPLRRQRGAVLTCSDGGRDGHKSKVVYTKNVEYTDFPLSEITLYFSDNTIYLPSEY